MASRACSHSVVYHDTSEDATKGTKWVRPDDAERLAANTLDGHSPALPPRNVPKPTTFPGPLVMPDDALAIDPDEWRQGLHHFANTLARKRVKPKRRTIYVIDAPTISPELAQAVHWQDPVVPLGADNKPPRGSTSASRPAVEDVAAYVKAFYHGLPVRVLKDFFRLVPWGPAEKNKAQSRRGTAKAAPGSDRYIGLAAVSPEASGSSTGTSKDMVTRIRHRPSLDGVTPAGQLNLNDLLDGLLAALPSDAFAAVLLLHHDMYEDDEDDFCCGRAYGGSRICVASTFRYHPMLGPSEGIIHEHTWPASHCREYVDDIWECSRETQAGAESSGRRRFNDSLMMRVPSSTAAKASTRPGTKSSSSSNADHNHDAQLPPLVAAVVASRGVLVPKSLADWNGLWLARTCVVVAHELGHCVGIGHCVYYACSMQGTASVAEDTQQPPYLCAVCQSKVAYSVAVEPVLGTHRQLGASARETRRLEIERDWTLRQHEAVRKFCEGYMNVGLFRGLEAWLGSRLRELQAVTEDEAVDDDIGMAGTHENPIVL